MKKKKKRIAMHKKQNTKERIKERISRMAFHKIKIVKKKLKAIQIKKFRSFFQPIIRQFLANFSKEGLV